jgi:hypothetical protein
MAKICVNSNWLANSVNFAMENSKASGFASSGEISLNITPGFGKSGTQVK